MRPHPSRFRNLTAYQSALAAWRAAEERKETRASWLRVALVALGLLTAVLFMLVSFYGPL